MCCQHLFLIFVQILSTLFGQSSELSSEKGIFSGFFGHSRFRGGDQAFCHGQGLQGPLQMRSCLSGIHMNAIVQRLIAQRAGVVREGVQLADQLHQVLRATAGILQRAGGDGDQLFV